MEHFLVFSRAKAFGKDSKYVNCQLNDVWTEKRERTRSLNTYLSAPRGAYKQCSDHYGQGQKHKIV